MGFMSLTLAQCPLFINSKKKIDRYGAEPIIGTYSFSKQVKRKKEITPCTVEDTLEILENDFLSYFEI